MFAVRQLRPIVSRRTSYIGTLASTPSVPTLRAFSSSRFGRRLEEPQPRPHPVFDASVAPRAPTLELPLVASCRPRLPEGTTVRLTRFTRDGAHQLLFKESAAGRPRRLTSCLSPTSNARGLCPATLPRVGIVSRRPRPLHNPFPHRFASTRSAVYVLLGYAHLGSRYEPATSKALRHVGQTSAAHIVFSVFKDEHPRLMRLPAFTGETPASTVEDLALADR